MRFEMLLGVEIYGGFAGGELTRGARAGLFGQTILSGDLLNDSIPGSASGRTEDSYCVVSCVQGIHLWTLDGFTVEFGHADNGPIVLPPTVGYIGPTHSGAGIYLQPPDVGLTAGITGGELRNVTVRECWALSKGAGAHLLGLVGGPNQPEIRPSIVVKCTFRNNIAYGSSPDDPGEPQGPGQGEGAGVYLFDAGEGLTFVNCTFFGNRSSRVGGGMTSRSLNGLVQLVNCLFTDNVSKSGAGLALPTVGDPTAVLELINCTIAYNDAISTTGHPFVGGGGVYMGFDPINSSSGQDELRIRNTIVSANTYRIVGSPSSIDNVSGPGAPLTSNPAIPSVVRANYSCIELSPSQVPPGGAVYWFGTTPLGFPTVLTGGPIFVNGPARDLRLAGNSPCINTGNENFIPAEVDNLTSFDGSGPLLPLVAFDLLLQIREMQPGSVNNWGLEATIPIGGNVPGAVVDMGCYEVPPPVEGGEG